jgi:hypothetical protein
MEYNIKMDLKDTSSECGLGSSGYLSQKDFEGGGPV